MTKIKFQISTNGDYPSSFKRYNNQVFLIYNNWDDWFEYSTTYVVIFYDHNGKNHSLGHIKIGQFGLEPSKIKEPGKRTPEFPSGNLNELPSNMFSLGQDDSYYENLTSFSNDVREEILRGLKDICFDELLHRKVLDERVYNVSFLRSVTSLSIEGHYRRLAHGRREQVSYSFQFVFPEHIAAGQKQLSFEVIPGALPQSNVHAIIGQNGVGKTLLVRNMVGSLIDENNITGAFGLFRSLITTEEKLFANLISISFSSFDENNFKYSDDPLNLRLKYTYVGMSSQNEQSAKTPQVLIEEFTSSLLTITKKPRLEKWLDWLKPLLETNSIFEFNFLGSEIEPKVDFEKAKEYFSSLSSGHKIILLSLTKLIELIEEKSLVLIDEPETHLHPPLLSQYLQILNKVLIDNNGVGILVTHSPVIVQELPKNCVWIMRRTGSYLDISRPRIETFGENVGILTREIFGLEIVKSGYHETILKVVSQENSFDGVMNRFNGALGIEAQSIVKLLLSNKNNEH